MSCADFEKDLVDRLSLGYGTVDDLAVNIIVEHDALRGTGLFVGAGDRKQASPAEEAEDVRGNFQHVSVHATHTSTQRGKEVKDVVEAEMNKYCQFGQYVGGQA
jgi:hypothetical protein